MDSQAGLSRRSFLSIAAAAASLGLAGVWTTQRLSDEDYPASRHAVFTPRVQAVLDRLGHLWLPDEQLGFPPLAQVPWLQSLAAVWAGMPDHLAGPVNRATEAFDLAALVYGWHGRPFVRLNDQQAQAYLARWVQATAAQRALIAAYRQLVHVAYWRHAPGWAPVGYLGPLHRRISLPVLGDAPEPGG